MRAFTFILLGLLLAPLTASAETVDFKGREILLTIPSNLPPSGQRSLVVALHGGGGSGRFMQSHLGMDDVAKKYGFIVAYLNGSDAGALLPGGMHAWNSGGNCCGQPARDDVDDVSYITGAVQFLMGSYGIEPSKIYVTGHSNGSMMAQRMMCETSLFAAAATMSGPIAPTQSKCSNTRPGPILAIHGEVDENVPLAGGKGTKGPTRVRRDVTFRSEASAKTFFEQQGGNYTIEIIPGADHSLERMDEVLTQQQGVGLSEKAARFFGLATAR